MRVIQFNNLVDPEGEPLEIEIDDDFDLSKLDEIKQQASEFAAHFKTVEAICPNCESIIKLLPFIDKQGWTCRCGRSYETSVDGTTIRHPLAGTGAMHEKDGCLPMSWEHIE